MTGCAGWACLVGSTSLGGRSWAPSVETPSSNTGTTTVTFAVTTDKSTGAASTGGRIELLSALTAELSGVSVKP